MSQKLSISRAFVDWMAATNSSIEKYAPQIPWSNTLIDDKIPRAHGMDNAGARVA